MTANFKDPSIFNDLRGSHVKFFGKTPEKIKRIDYDISEVFMTVNNRNVIRGLHFQVNPDQPKIITCVNGAVIVNIVCLDIESENFKKVYRYELHSAPESPSYGMIDVPSKHALGYRTLHDNTRMLYLAGADFNSIGDIGINPFDEELKLDWGFTTDFILSERDKNLPNLYEYIESL